MSADTYLTTDIARTNFALLREMGIFSEALWVNQARINFNDISVTIDLNVPDFINNLLTQVWHKGKRMGEIQLRDKFKSLMGLV